MFVCVGIVKLDRECCSLRRSKEDLEQRSGELEQRCHELSSKLKVSELNLRELEGASGQCSQLESQLKQATEQMEEKERRSHQLEEVCLEGRSAVIAG